VWLRGCAGVAAAAEGGAAAGARPSPAGARGFWRFVRAAGHNECHWERLHETRPYMISIAHEHVSPIFEKSFVPLRALPRRAPSSRMRGVNQAGQSAAGFLRVTTRLASTPRRLSRRGQRGRGNQGPIDEDAAHLRSGHFDRGWNAGDGDKRRRRQRCGGLGGSMRHATLIQSSRLLLRASARFPADR
jgi:hypothetical protein